MIYVTADTHMGLEGDMRKLTMKKFPEQKSLTKSDYVIIAGDWSVLWHREPTKEQLAWLEFFNTRKYTTLFVDGNHENHDLLVELPIIDFCGGKVGKVSDTIYHLRRGEIYEIEGKKIFTMGGACSADMQTRNIGIDWWPQEVPNYSEMNYALDNLEKHNWTVDIVITHAIASTLLPIIKETYEPDTVTKFLDEIYKRVNYKEWFFGHYHKDISLDPKHRCIYKNVVKIV